MLRSSDKMERLSMPVPKTVIVGFLILSFGLSVNLLDTSTAQSELGWLLDPPETGVSTMLGKEGQNSGVLERNGEK